MRARERQRNWGRLREGKWKGENEERPFKKKEEINNQLLIMHM